MALKDKLVKGVAGLGLAGALTFNGCGATIAGLGAARGNPGAMVFGQLVNELEKEEIEADGRRDAARIRGKERSKDNARYTVSNSSLNSPLASFKICSYADKNEDGFAQYEEVDWHDGYVEKNKTLLFPSATQIGFGDKISMDIYKIENDGRKNVYSKTDMLDKDDINNFIRDGLMHQMFVVMEGLDCGNYLVIWKINDQTAKEKLITSR